MPTGIESVTIDTIIDKRITLSLSQYAAVMDIGSSWTRLRLGCRMALSDSGANITGTPRFYFGLLASPSSGMVNGPLNASAGHFIGYHGSSATWTRTSGGSSYYNTQTNSCVGTKVGTTFVSGAPSSINQYHSLKPATNRNVWLIEFEKLSSVLTRITLITVNNNTNDTGDASEEELRNAMEYDTMSGAEDYLDAVVGQVHAQGSSSASIATDEALNGAWNAVCLGWGKTTPVMHISDILYAVHEE